MPGSNIAGKVQTVLGPIEPDALGVTLTHEHLLVDLSVIHTEPAQASATGFYHEPVSMKALGRIRHYGQANLDNSRLLDIDTAIEEASLYRQNGGDTLVDATSVGIRRDPQGLARISRATGVNIVMGSSFYVDVAHPAYVNDASEHELARQIVNDVAEGVDGTRIRSGIIGEIGCSWPLTENERKVLRASAAAQRTTGAPILIHPGRDETSPIDIIGVLTEAGADLNRTIIGHLDRTVFLHETLQKIAEAGCFLEWDLFGQEQSHYPLNPDIAMPNDSKRMDDITWISSQGFGRKIVVSHDICSKHRLEKYGGHGYSYIIAHIVPRMRSRGINEEAIQALLVANPRDALTFAEPGSG
ncbi:MAG: aryldialkylphosphatase [Chloroflexi bacterium]|nr:aryldialkylphosphatase [Chloroflexota bacterium]